MTSAVKCVTGPTFIWAGLSVYSKSILLREREEELPAIGVGQPMPLIATCDWHSPEEQDWMTSF